MLLLLESLPRQLRPAGLLLGLSRPFLASEREDDQALALCADFPNSHDGESPSVESMSARNASPLGAWEAHPSALCSTFHRISLQNPRPLLTLSSFSALPV